MGIIYGYYTTLNLAQHLVSLRKTFSASCGRVSDQIWYTFSNVAPPYLCAVGNVFAPGSGFSKVSKKTWRGETFCAEACDTFRRSHLRQAKAFGTRGCVKQRWSRTAAVQCARSRAHTDDSGSPQSFPGTAKPKWSFTHTWWQARHSSSQALEREGNE